MNPTTKIWLDAVSDFVIAAGGVLAGGIMEQTGAAQVPGAAAWLLAGIQGCVAAFKQVKARLAEPPTK